MRNYLIIFEAVYWLLIGIIAYIYVGYPMLCFFIGKIIRKPILQDDSFSPFVTMIISAYNEEKFIAQKIDNTLNLDYPKEKLQILIASDGSVDKTNEIVKRYTVYGIQLLEFKRNRGKTLTQNDAVKHSKGDIIVFSDANAIYKEDAIKKIVRNFKDSSVGCVCGELRYMDEKKAAVEGEGLYWRYERSLKVLESKICNVLGANGSIYAVRKKLYVPLKKDIISDFVEPLKIVEQGYRNVYESKAISFESASSNYKSEFQRKVRIITRSYRGLLSSIYLLNPFRYGFLAISLLSHKLLRWFAWIFLLMLLIVNTLLALNIDMIYTILLLIQLVFYLLALIGILSNRLWKPLLIPAYFCMVNYSSFLGLLHYYTRDKVISWQPVRE